MVFRWGMYSLSYRDVVVSPSWIFTPVIRHAIAFSLNDSWVLPPFLIVHDSMYATQHNTPQTGRVRGQYCLQYNLQLHRLCLPDIRMHLLCQADCCWSSYPMAWYFPYIPQTTVCWVVSVLSVYSTTGLVCQVLATLANHWISFNFFPACNTWLFWSVFLNVHVLAAV